MEVGALKKQMEKTAYKKTNKKRLGKVHLIPKVPAIQKYWNINQNLHSVKIIFNNPNTTAF